MIELKRDELVFKFPDVHRKAEVRVNFQRTLRIPDDGNDYPLPAGLGRFPVRHVDDFGERVPSRWSEHGGVMLPMYQSEALWLNFAGDYPFALKIAAGKINAVSEKGFIRQFVAMPLGSGYSAEEQITGEAEHGGIQIIAYPMRREVYERRFGTSMMRLEERAA